MEWIIGTVAIAVTAFTATNNEPLALATLIFGIANSIFFW
jgi:hypothetical protein